MLKTEEAAAFLAELNVAKDTAHKTIDGIFERYKILENQDDIAEFFFQKEANEIVGFARGAGWSLDELLGKIRSRWALVEQLEKMKVS